MSALDTQIGGDHYKDMPIQPMEFSMANGLDACQHTIIKYVTRFREKGGVQDLEKAKHVIDMLIEFDQKGVKPAPAAAQATEQAPEKAGEWLAKKPAESLGDFISRLINDDGDSKAMADAAQDRLLAEIRAMFPNANISVTFVSEESGLTD